MEVRAIAKYVRVQPRKVRIIADEVRGGAAVYVRSQLRYHRSKSAHALHKVLVSAIANAKENHGVDEEQLRVAAITVDEGPKLKRMQARAMGRGNRIEKKTSHITVVVSDDLEVEVKGKKVNKAKPRPTFGNARRGKGVPANQTVTFAATPAAVEPVTPGETTDTDAEEATPVTSADQPEQEGTATPIQAETPAEGASEDEIGAQ
jgi:large subunit ribosomal protein L22